MAMKFSPRDWWKLEDRIREEGGFPHRSFENQWRNTNILHIISKGILWRFRFNSNFSKNILISRLYEQFSRNDSAKAPEWLSEKISDF